MTHTVGDGFFKKSERYKLNPEFSPKHVGMPWAVCDASDFVKPSAIIMAQKYKVTEEAVPLFKAYNTFEHSGMSYD